jgi:Spy/CpxP family protein refolding chaperone
MKVSTKKWLGASVLGLAAVGFLAPAVSYAAPKQGQGQKDSKRVDPLDRLQNVLAQLDLTDDQKTQIDAIITPARQQLEDIKKGDDDRKAKQTKTREVLEQTREKVTAVLTDQQKTKLKEITANERGKRAGKQKQTKPDAGN